MPSHATPAVTDAIRELEPRDVLIALRELVEPHGLEVDVRAKAPSVARAVERDRELELLRGRVTDLAEEVEAYRQSAHRNAHRIGELEEERDSARRGRDHAIDTNVRLRADLAEEEENRAATERRVAELADQVARMAAERDDLNRELGRLRLEVDQAKDGADQPLDVDASTYLAVVARANELEHQRDASDAQAATLVNANAELRDALEGAEALADELEDLKAAVARASDLADVEAWLERNVRQPPPDAAAEGTSSLSRLVDAEEADRALDEDDAAPPAAGPPQDSPAAPVVHSPPTGQDLRGQWRSDTTAAAARHNDGLIDAVLGRRPGVWFPPRAVADELGIDTPRVGAPLRRLVERGHVEHNGRLRSAARYRVPVAEVLDPADVEGIVRAQGAGEKETAHGSPPGGPLQPRTPDRAVTVALDPPEPANGGREGANGTVRAERIEPWDGRPNQATAEAADVAATIRERVDRIEERRKRDAARELDLVTSSAKVKSTIEGAVFAAISAQPDTIDGLAARLRGQGYAKRDVAAVMLKLREDGELEATGAKAGGNNVYRAIRPAV